MYCPKCREVFEEGSRRFCPTDGSRLIPDQATSSGKQWEGDIFSNLIPRPEPTVERAKYTSDTSRFRVTEPALSEPTEKGDFFILEDIEPEPMINPILSEPPLFQPSSAEFKAPFRKIDPQTVPAGHVELGESDRLAVSSADFRADDPEAFIGRTVKGRYVVTDYFGGDESGYAFLADDKITPDRKVLVRILLRGDTDEMMGSILDEERVSLSHFSHPNIARLIDSGQFTDGKLVGP